jgi:hypothetical protein
MLTEEHKNKRRVAVLKVFVRYHQEGDNFFHQIATGSEARVLHRRCVLTSIS